MAATTSTTEICRLLSPEHAAHGWSPDLDVEVAARLTGSWTPDSAIEVSISLAWRDLGDTPPTECPCGEKVIEFTDARLDGKPAADLIHQATGIEFFGPIL